MAVDFIITSPTVPTVTSVAGTITIDDNGDGTFHLYGDATTFQMSGNKADITKIEVIDSSSLTSCANMFQYCNDITEFIGNNAFANVTDFTATWENCISLTLMGSINTSKGTTFGRAWNGCTSLQCLGKVNTLIANITNNMFQGTPNLVNPNASEQSQILSGYDYINTNVCIPSTIVEFNFNNTTITDFDYQGTDITEYYLNGALVFNKNSQIRLIKVKGGISFTMLLFDNGELYASGLNDQGQLGTGDNSTKYVFTLVASGVTDVGCGQSFTAIIKDNGTVWTTGLNSSGQLGLGHNNNVNSFTQTPATATSISCGQEHTCIISGGKVHGTGKGSGGRLGTGNVNSVNVFTNTNHSADVLACGGRHTCIIQSNVVYTTGRNTEGQLAVGNNTSLDVFTAHYIPVSAVQISAGTYHTVIIKSDGSVWSAGLNLEGELGLGGGPNKNIFTDTGTSADFIHCGGWYTVKIENNTMSSCGSNADGQLGIGHNNNVNVFTDETQNKNVSILGGGVKSTITDVDAIMWSTGDNEFGALGLNSSLDKNVLTDTSFGVAP